MTSAKAGKLGASRAAAVSPEAAAEALPGAPATEEIYCSWERTPIVVSRHRGRSELSWDAARVLLQDRVQTAIAPRLSAGWRLDGTFIGSVRWNMTTGAGSDTYEGCWVRLRRGDG